MHISWLYCITGISGYSIESQKAVRNGRERKILNAVNCIRSASAGSKLLNALRGLDIVLILAVLTLIMAATKGIDDTLKPNPARPKSRCNDMYIVIRIKSKRKEDLKRGCKSCKGHDVAFRKGEYRRIRSLDFGRVKVFIEVEVRRLRCRTCGKKFDEKLPFLVSPKARVTRMFEWQMVEMRSFMSISDVARWLDVDWRTVKDAEKRVLKARYKRIDLKRARIIGIDEMYLFHEEKSNRKYITVVRDMETGEVLNVSRGKGADALKAFAWRLRTQKARIECVCMDMSNAYISWVKANLPDALVVYDHFHVIKAMNERINTVRRAAMARISADVRRRIDAIDVTSLAKEDVRAAIAKERALEEKAKESLKGNMRLPMANKEDVEKDPKAKARLDRMLEENEDISAAYLLKEKLRSIYAEAKTEGKARVLFTDWIAEAKESKVSQLATMARTLESHLDGVLGFWKFNGASNAKTEGFNNKIRWLIRQAYGYRDFKYLKLKIFDLPNITLRENDY